MLAKHSRHSHANAWLQQAQTKVISTTTEQPPDEMADLFDNQAGISGWHRVTATVLEMETFPACGVCDTRLLNSFKQVPAPLKCPKCKRAYAAEGEGDDETPEAITGYLGTIELKDAQDMAVVAKSINAVAQRIVQADGGTFAVKIRASESANELPLIQNAIDITSVAE